MIPAEAERVGRRQRQRRIVLREERTPPTAQTLAKLTADPLLQLDPEHQRAALAIDLAYRLITAPVSQRAATYERMGAIGSRWGNWGATLSELIDAYAAWVDELARHRMPYLRLMTMIVDREPGPVGTLAEALDLWKWP